MVKSFFVAFVAFASVFASVWRKKHPEKMCTNLNIFATWILQKGLLA